MQSFIDVCFTTTNRKKHNPFMAENVSLKNDYLFAEKIHF